MPLPLTYTEMFDSRQMEITSDGVNTTEVFHVDEFDPYIVQTGLPSIGSLNPDTFSFLRTINVRPIEAINPDTGKPGYCEVELVYGPPQAGGDNANSNGEVWVWDMNAKTVHIDNVPETADQLTSTANPNGGGMIENQSISNLIGVDGDNVKGTDVFRPSGSLRVTKYLPKTSVTTDYRRTLYSAQNTLNDADWFDWFRRQVLFLGSRIQFNLTEDTAQVDFNFLIGSIPGTFEYEIFKSGKLEGPIDDPSSYMKKVSVEVPLGGGDSTSLISPWDVISIQTAVKQIPISGNIPTPTVPVRGIESVSVARVYETYDFTQFGLGDPDAA